MVLKPRTYFCILLLSYLALLISGCWDQVEIKERAIVVGLGIDKTPEGFVRVTAQIVNFGSSKGEQRTSEGTTGLTGTQGSSQQNNSVSVLTSTGRSFFDAIHKFIQSSSRRITFTHNRIIVLGNDLAKSGISGILDVMARDSQFRRTNWFLATNNTAREIMELQTGLGSIPAKEIDQMLRNLSNNPLIPPVTLNDFLVDIKSEGKAAVMPLIELEPSDNAGGSASASKVKIEKMAVFKNDRLCGTLTAEESQGLLWLIAKNKGGDVAVPYLSSKSPNMDQKPVWLKISNGTSKIQPLITHSGLLIKITCQGTGTLIETEEFMNNSRTIKQLEIKSARILEREVERTIRKSQQFSADFPGFAGFIHGEYPENWRQLKNNWEQEYPRIRTKVGFQINITGFGFIKNSILKNNQ
jgi:spore germination protein KC